MRDLTNKVKELISEIFQIDKEILNLNFIDHSILDRNYVYTFNIGLDDFIIKISYSREKWENEIRVLKLLKDLYFVPNIIDEGIKYDLRYIIMEKFQGETLIDEIDKFSKKKQLEMIEKLGESLALIHNTGEFNFFSWEEGKKAKLREVRNYKDKNIIRKLQHCENELVKEGTKLLDKYRPKLIDTKPRLTHKDYSLRNILVLESGKLSGILDYEHTEPEDPCLDICSMYHTDILDDELFFEAFKLGYEKIVEFPINFLLNKNYYMINTGLYLYGRFSEKGLEARDRGLDLIKNSLND
jgi:fructosamine-3-kinase